MEGTYSVERILKRRFTHDGQKQYLIKWKGYANSSNTWEPLKHLESCPDLVAEFDRRQEKRTRQKAVSRIKQHVKQPNTSPVPDINFQGYGGSNPSGFSLGLEADYIIGASPEGKNGDILFLLKWKNSNNVELVTAKEANVKCPQVVIAFYESKLNWNLPASLE